MSQWGARAVWDHRYRRWGGISLQRALQKCTLLSRVVCACELKLEFQVKTVTSNDHPVCLDGPPGCGHERAGEELHGCAGRGPADGRLLRARRRRRYAGPGTGDVRAAAL